MWHGCCDVVSTIQNMEVNKMDTNYQTPIDMTYLVILTDSDPEEEKELFEIFSNQMNKSIKELEMSFVNKDNQEWEKIAHRMKGSSASLGANILSEACKEAEYNATCSQIDKEEYLLNIAGKLSDVMEFFTKITKGEKS
jgi:HPt (histidine-containing phosphotransfer) domain-containing protein